jgi:hypothetical protein
LNPDVAAAVLNVGINATHSEVHAAFRLRARLTHPDRFAGAPAGDIRAASAEFVRITQARDVLLKHLPKPPPPPPSTPPTQARPAGQKHGPDSEVPRRQFHVTFDEFVAIRERQSWTPSQT